MSDALAAAAIPRERWGRRRLAALAEPERRLYRWILTSFRAGDPPTVDDLAAVAAELDLPLEQTLAKLAHEDLVHHDAARGEITVAYPFSRRPTAHTVRSHDGSEAFAMCAIDAVGIAPMFGESIAISSRDPLTGEQIQVTLAPEGDGRWLPDEAVVVCGASGSGESCTSCCPVLNFFASAASAEGWLAAHREVQGCVISMDEAIAAGRAVFGDLLKEA